MMKRIGLVLCVSSVLLGCGFNRVTIRSVPEKSAALQERASAFKDLAPESGLATTYLRNGVQVDSTINFLMLGDGTRVEDPQDLLPAMEPNSAAFNFTQSYVEKSSAATVWSSIGYGSIVVGMLAMVAPILLPFDANNMNRLFIGLGVGSGIALLALVPMLVGMSKRGQANLDRISAFQTYPKSLQKRLALEDGAPGQEPAKPKQPDQARLITDAPLVSGLSLP